MSRFKTSKYKNATPKIPDMQKCITGLHVGTLDSFGNHIKANCTFVAFNTDGSQGGHLSVIPYEDKERHATPILLSAHADFITDFDFSPFDDSVLATCSKDCSIKIWKIPESEYKEAISNPETTLHTQQKRVETVLFNPAAENVLASSAGKEVKVWDISTGQEKFCLTNHDDVVQSITWKEDGSLLATGCKDKKIRIFDPRSSSLVQEAPCFDGGKETKVLWAGDKEQIIASGFNKMRQQELGLWDSRSLDNCLERRSVGSSTGSPLMFFDQDTNMLLVAAKGETSVHYIELKDTASYLSRVSTHRVADQIKGAALIPKLAVDVMTCEVLRLMVLTKSSVVPLSYHVPRKSYRAFHGDLFPVTFNGEPSMTSDEWFQGANTPRSKTSLDPSKRPAKDKKKQPSKSEAAKSEAAKSEPPKPLPKPVHESKKTPPASPTSSPCKEDHCKTTTDPAPIVHPSETGSKCKQSSPEKSAFKRTHKALASQHHSKFRHLTGTPLHRSQYIENIRDLSNSLFGECDGFQVNSKRAAVPIEGPGGKIAVFELSKTGRLPESGIPVLENKCGVMDFVMSPFDEQTIAVACENASVKLWKTGEEGLTETTDEPAAVLRGHRDRATIVRYHPTANNVLTSASFDLSINIWDVNKETAVLSLVGHLEPLYSMAWNRTGNLLATFCRDQNIRLFDPRASTSSQRLGSGPAGGRGGRVTWAGPHGDWLLLSGFDRSRRRQISLYDSRDLLKELARVELDTSPSTLIPHVDVDTNVCLLTAKGDTTIFAYEIIAEPPHLFELSHIKVGEAHQAVAFCRKTACDVKEVEFLKAFRLTKTFIEPFVFGVPRVQKEYFQDDIFPETTVTWEPSLTSDDWFNGQNKEQRKISLKPTDMKLLSEAPKVEVVKKYESQTELGEYKTDQQKKEELLSAMSGKLTNYDSVPLPQDLSEGVDESEWDD